jgi:AraC-like DNA-binding protein
LASKDKILIHQDELKGSGIDIIPLQGLTLIEYDLHRDDHYMFIIQKSGHLVFEVDFNKIEINKSAVCYVAPGQVHRYISAEKCEGWVMFVDPDHIPKQFRETFDAFLNVTQVTSLDINDLLFSFTDHLEKYWLNKKENDELMRSVTKSLLEAVSGMIASNFFGTSTKFNRINSSKYILAARFKQLIKERFTKLKQVKEYASLLHITPIYLNEVMNEMTGFPASYWIRQEIILEAKRLLAYSGKDINEISWELGYEDHAYFSRFFKKNTGITASAFREQKP